MSKFTIIEFDDFDDADGTILAINANLFDKRLAAMIADGVANESGCKYMPIEQGYVYFGFGSTSIDIRNGWWLVDGTPQKKNHVPVHVFRKVDR